MIGGGDGDEGRLIICGRNSLLFGWGVLVRLSYGGWSSVVCGLYFLHFSCAR